MSDRKTIQVIHHAQTQSGYGGLGIMLTHTAGDSFIYLTTAHCSTNDRYVKKLAVQELNSQFAAGAKVKLGVTNRRMNHAELRSLIYQFFNV